MRVHAAAVVTEERLGHEGRGLAVLSRHVFDDVFVEHHRVGGLDQRVEAEINFGLAGCGDFVVLTFDGDPELFHDQAHLGADVLLGVGRGHREVTFLVTDLVAEIGHFIPAGVPCGFLAIDGVEAAVAPCIELHIVEDEKLGFGSENSGVRDAS